MNKIEQAVFDKLITVAPPGVAVYLHQAPQEDNGDLLVFWVTGRSDIPGTAPITTQEIRVSCYGQVHAAVETLAGEVWDELAWWQYGAPGLRLGPLTLENTDADFESEFNQFRVTLVWAAQAVEWSV